MALKDSNLDKPQRYSFGFVEGVVSNPVGSYSSKRPGLLRRLSSALLESVGSKPFEFEADPSSGEDFEQWRWQQPLNMADPMSIKRNTKRRVTFDSIWNRRSLLSSAKTDEKIAQCHSKAKDDLDGGADDIWSMRKAESVSEFHLLSTSDENSQELETHINTTFRYDEVNRNYCFLSAFGTKGRNIGEYQDAKSITCLPRGRTVISDYVNSRLQICSDLSKTVTVFSPDEIHLPWAAAVTKDNHIAVTLCKDQCVKIFNMDGDVISSFGEGHFVKPTGLATDKNGNFVVCDSRTDKVSMFDSQGKFIRFLGNPDVADECFSNPCYVCVSVTDDVIVSDGGHHRIKVFNSKGDFVRSFGSFGKGDKQFKSPHSVATNIYGDIFVADHYNSRISMFTRDGVFIRHIVTSEHGLVHPQGLTVSPDLRMYVSHGHLKASEILVFQLTTDVNYECSDLISYV